MNKDCLSIEVYIVKGQEYIRDCHTPIGITSTYTLSLFKDNIPYKITFECKKNGDKEDEFQKQTKYRNYPLYQKIYIEISAESRKDEVKLIDENPYVKAEITKEYIKFIIDLDKMAQSGIIENIKINEDTNSQTPHS